MKSLYLDFEFNNTKSSPLNLVCCATLDQDSKETKKWWLHKDKKEYKRLADYISKFDLLKSYSAVAEARSIIALGLDPLNFKWIDFFLEYRTLSNHNDKLNFGKQLKDGKIVSTYKPKPKWERNEDDEEKEGFRPTWSLAEATYKLLGEVRDTEHKTKMRDLIISAPDDFSPTDKEDILQYCLDDVIYLPMIEDTIIEKYSQLIGNMENLTNEMLVRGNYAALTAIMEEKGYPIDVEATKNFSKQVGSILFDCQKEINELFPDILPFKWNKLTSNFRWDQIATREWVEKNHDVSSWDKTEKGDISLSLEAWEKMYPYKHDYPSDKFGAQMVRFLKLKQSLYGFVPSKTSKKNFWDSVGPDGRVRPYMGIYTAQSSRSQPSSTGFMFLKPAWMRALVVPAKGKAMAGIDFGSQEFFISALQCKDSNMISAYMSGDVYFAFAKLARMVPAAAKREDFEFERDLCKSTTLGINFNMTKYGLSKKLTLDSGKIWTEEKAQEMIDKFYGAYPGLKPHQESVLREYKKKKYIKLPCGFYMFGDNPNERSIGNMPIQGMGASILRKAVDIVMRKGIYVPFTLHDAIYIEYDIGQEEQIGILRDAMREAFCYYFEGKWKELASNIRLDPKAWGYDDNVKEIILKDGWKIPASKLYIDKRAKSDYDKFSKYFLSPITDLL
jgi:hypothetical protein